jgi:LmbE family N-acetylglucosaminyl deacetylase
MRVLAVNPHTDDCILIAGGTICRLVEEGHDVYYAGLCVGEATTPKGFAPNCLEAEIQAATTKLGVQPKNVFIVHFPDQRFNEYRQDILDYLVMLRNRIQPDVVIIPSCCDTHQDHEVTHKECVRAFKNTACIYGYDWPWNDLNGGAKLSLFYELDESHMKKKVEAVNCIKSRLGKNYMTEQYVYGLAVERGVRIKTPFAEAFEVIREIRRRK